MPQPVLKRRTDVVGTVPTPSPSSACHRPPRRAQRGDDRRWPSLHRPARSPSCSTMTLDYRRCPQPPRLTTGSHGYITPWTLPAPDRRAEDAGTRLL